MTDAFAINAPDATFAAPFRYRQLNGRYLVTNYVGQYAFLEPVDFKAFVEGTLDKDGAANNVLRERNLLRGGLNVDDMVRRLARKTSFLDFGPHLHIVEVTLRCNQTCVYCHSSRVGMQATDKDMTPETAERVVELIFQSNSPSLTIEFQGGEPLVNFPVVRQIVESALRRNQSAGRNLEFTLVSNLLALDQEKLEFLLDHKVQICTSIDGPPDLHNRQRTYVAGDAFRETERWIKRINEAYVTQKLDPEVYHVEGLLTTTRETLGRPREVVDAYLGLGFSALFLRPVDPFGFATKLGHKLGVSPQDFLVFYRAAVDYIIELNLDGKRMLERSASLFLTKILLGEDPNFLDLRSPCGAAIGQLAYSADGKVFTCDEARMLHAMGDDFFCLGDIKEIEHAALMTHETVKSLVIASNLEASPDCARCVYNPYCGICPVYNYATQGSIHGQQRNSNWCAINMGIQDYLFEKLEKNDPRVMDVFARWVTVRPRDHYLHLGGVSP
jgi:uncharacterized protein